MLRLTEMLGKVPTSMNLLCHADHALRVVATLIEADKEAASVKSAMISGPQRSGKIAVIPVMGPLRSRGWNGYDSIRMAVRDATRDPDVSAIILHLDTPGGAVSGIDGMTTALREAREAKPVYAYVEGMAASAGYWIASQADEIIMSPLSEVGSIGVVTMHLDISKALADFGVNPTLIFSGANKVNGNPFEPLPDGVRAEIQSEVDDLRLSFARAVNEGRPKLASDAALATEARMYTAKDAIALGMADRIGSLDDVVAMASETTPRFRAQSSNTEKEAMADTDNQAVDPQAAVHADRQRMQAILQHDAAKGREGLAQHLAFNTDMSVEAAVAALNASPAAAEASPAPAPEATVPTIAQRQTPVAQPDPNATGTKPDPRASWSTVIQRANAQVHGGVSN